MSSLFRKLVVFIALSIVISSPALAKAKDESDGKTAKPKSSLTAKKKASKSSAKKATTKKTISKKTSSKKSKGTANTSKEQYKNITVNINKASAAALSAYLMNIGPARATAIEKYRKANGKFKSIDDLLKVEGIGEKILGDIKKNLSLSRGETTAPEGYKMGQVNKSSTSKKSSAKKKSGSSSSSSKSKRTTDSSSTSSESKKNKKTNSKKASTTSKAKKSSDKPMSPKAKKTTKAKKPVKKAKTSAKKKMKKTEKK